MASWYALEREYKARSNLYECSLSESKLHIKNIRSLILAYEIAVPDNSIEKTPIKIIIKTDFVNIIFTSLSVEI